MKTQGELKSISDDDLLRRLSELLKNSRRVEADMIAHLAEVDARRLYSPCASIYLQYCSKVLHMSEYEAFLRMRVARVSRKYPVLLDMLADGRLHLSGITSLLPSLPKTTRDRSGSSRRNRPKREIEELVVELFPKPDVPPSIRKQPERRKKASQNKNGELGPDLVSSPESDPRKRPWRPQRNGTTADPVPAKPAEVKPLSPVRYKISFTASAELRDKLERLRSLMRSSVPDGDLAAVIEEAVTEKLEKLEAKRYGTTKNPRKNLRKRHASSSRYIPAPVSGLCMSEITAGVDSKMRPVADVQKPNGSSSTTLSPTPEAVTTARTISFYLRKTHNLLSRATRAVEKKKYAPLSETPGTEFPNQRLYTLSVIDYRKAMN